MSGLRKGDPSATHYSLQSVIRNQDAPARKERCGLTRDRHSYSIVARCMRLEPNLKIAGQHVSILVADMLPS